MRPLLAALLLTLVVTASVEAADRYLIATRSVPRETGLRMLRDSGDAGAHRVRTFRTLNAFAATLTDSEAAVLRQSPEVLSVTKVVPRQISGTATASFAPRLSANVLFSSPEIK